MAVEPFRCSAASEARDEDLAGTASTVRSWLLLEHAGPWGIDAFADARLPPGLGDALLARCSAANVRPLLIRRVGAGSTDGSGASAPTCFAVRSGPEAPWIERTRLGSLEDALALDVGALGRGERVGIESYGRAMFLVCTHGRHDTCCAERGRPLARALANVFAEETWECSHIGGDRFAGNLVAFPHGLYFGRVMPAEAEPIARGYLGGRIDLPRFRGRSCYAMPVQAAEHALRVGLGLDGVDDVALETISRIGDEVDAHFVTATGAFEVRVRVRGDDRHLLTCRSTREDVVPSYRVEIERV